MIKFFRKIRQNLLAEGKTGKYLKYVIVEILLVVIGILIALQINNGNENRKRVLLKKNLLNQLSEDLNRSLQDMKVNIKTHHQSIHSAQIILQHMAKNKPYNDSISSYLAASFIWTSFRLDLGAYETIRSVGVDI